MASNIFSSVTEAHLPVEEALCPVVVPPLGFAINSTLIRVKSALLLLGGPETAHALRGSPVAHILTRCNSG